MRGSTDPTHPELNGADSGCCSWCHAVSRRRHMSHIHPAFKPKRRAIFSDANLRIKFSILRVSNQNSTQQVLVQCFEGPQPADKINHCRLPHTLLPHNTQHGLISPRSAKPSKLIALSLFQLHSKRYTELTDRPTIDYLILHSTTRYAKILGSECDIRPFDLRHHSTGCAFATRTIRTWTDNGAFFRHKPSKEH